MRPFASAGLLFLFFAATQAWGRGIAYPQNSYALTPNGRWEISCRTTEDGNGGGLHALYATRRGTKEAGPFYASDRWCEVLANEINDTVAVTDWEGSSIADVFIVDLREPAKRQALGEIVPKLAEALAPEERGGHCYWEALAWEGANVLAVQAFGHTDEAHGHAFRYKFTVSLAAGTFLLERKEVDDGAEERACQPENDKYTIDPNDQGAQAQYNRSLHNSAMAARAEEAIRRHLERTKLEEEIVARRYFTGDIDGDGIEDLLVATSFCRPGSNAWSQDLVLIRSTKPEVPIVRNIGGKGVRSYREIWMSREGIAADFLYYAKGDALCCPSEGRKGYFKLQGDLLVEVAELSEKNKKPEAAAGPVPASAGTAAVPAAGEYVVQPGDSGAKIARKFGLSLEELRTLNPDVKWDRLHVGQVVRVRPAEK